jgi:hypothetical protein
MNYAQWKAAYQPIDNAVSGTKMFATEGAERDTVLIFDFVYIWTLVETAKGLELIAGAGFDNPLGYFVGKIPWNGGDIPANVPYTD